MKTIKYESPTMLPTEIMDEMKKMGDRIHENRYEPDKIECIIGNFRGYLIRWFADKQEPNDE